MIRKRKGRYIFVTTIFPTLIILVYFFASIYLPKPKIANLNAIKIPRTTFPDQSYQAGNCYLRKNKDGLYEMYLEGDGFTRGVMHGKLCKELSEFQETVFIQQIRQMIPSETYLNFLKYFVGYFNRNMPDFIPDEYLQEIYGVSLYASDKYDNLAPKYYRILNYHAAHDIGHVLQDKHLVPGCTSFGTWGKKSENGKLWIGRNFDFYAGKDFAKNKIALFVKPEKGIPFVCVTWAGFTGVVSGMNLKGLTVTINAAQSEVPYSAADPVSLVAKEILQYAGNIKDALSIARKRKTFISESFLIGSAADGKCSIIEKTPEHTYLFETKEEFISCANHFQSDSLKHDLANLNNILDNASYLRQERMNEMLLQCTTMNAQNASRILRNMNGLHNVNIGWSNELAINQMIAHHSVIFCPTEKRVWISTQPYQMGNWVCYNLDSVFNTGKVEVETTGPYCKTNEMEGDSIFIKEEYQKFLIFRQIKSLITLDMKLSPPRILSATIIRTFINSNPESYLTYKLLGEYYLKISNWKEAENNFIIALRKKIPSRIEKMELVDALSRKHNEK